MPAEKPRVTAPAVEIKMTPEIESALAEQLRKLPDFAVRKPDAPAANVFGLVGCCNG